MNETVRKEALKQRLINTLFDAVELMNKSDLPQFVNECLDLLNDIEEELSNNYNVVIDGLTDNNKIEYIKVMQDANNTIAERWF